MLNILDASINPSKLSIQALHPPLLDTPLSFIFTQKEDTHTHTHTHTQRFTYRVSIEGATL